MSTKRSVIDWCSKAEKRSKLLNIMASGLCASKTLWVKSYQPTVRSYTYKEKTPSWSFEDGVWTRMCQWGFCTSGILWGCGSERLMGNIDKLDLIFNKRLPPTYGSWILMVKLSYVARLSVNRRMLQYSCECIERDELWNHPKITIRVYIIYILKNIDNSRPIREKHIWLQIHHFIFFSSSLSVLTSHCTSSLGCNA